MPTLVGTLFVLIALVCFWRKDGSLFATVIFSSIFQGASLTTGGSLGLQPYYLLVALFIAQTLLLTRGDLVIPAFSGRNALLLFGGVAFVSAFTLPFLFAGLPIYDKSIGIDDGFFYRPPLQFSLSNITQAAFLVLNILLVIAARKLPATTALPAKASRLAFYFLAAVIISQVLCSALNIPFPDKLFLNNPGYAIQDAREGGIMLRAPGTFSESSFAGAFLVMSCAGFLADFIENGSGLLEVTLAIAAIFAVRSTSSFLSIPLVLFLLVIRKPLFYGSGFIRMARVRRVALLCTFLGLLLLILFLSPIGSIAILSVAEKGETSSFINRTAADLHAADLLALSKGLGVGLGSNRPSSIVASLLSNTGVIGFVTFSIMYFQIVREGIGRYRWIRWAGLGLFLDMAFGIPDISFPPIWALLALAVHFGSDRFAPISSSFQDGTR